MGSRNATFVGALGIAIGVSFAGGTAAQGSDSTGAFPPADTAAPPATTPPAAPPAPPPGQASPPPAVPPPPPGPAAAPAASQPAPPPQQLQPPPPPPQKDLDPRPAELFLGLGLGNAVCDNEKPDSDCPVDGAGAFTLGGGWRFHPKFSFGIELSTWAFNVRESWKGQLDEEATDVEFSSTYLAPYLRWYFADGESPAAYLQAGIGFGSVQATATSAQNEYKAQITGFAFPLGIGAEWHLSEHFRLGGQALAYLQLSQRACETSNGNEECMDADSDKNNALPWRLMLVGTFIFGAR